MKENTDKFIERAKPDCNNSDNSIKILLSSRNVHLTLMFLVCVSYLPPVNYFYINQN